MIRVVAVDDQALVRMGLRTLLAGEPDIDLVGEAADGAQALRLIRQVKPDVVVLDLKMPGVDGVATLQAITADPALVAVHVLVLTTFDLEEYVLDALAAGASGFLVKDAEPTELLRAIRVVAAGESLLSPTVTRTVIRRLVNRTGTGHRPQPGWENLTDREREVVGLVASGLSNDEIAVRLVVSAATVRTHISRALAKTGARDRAQLVVYAYRSGTPLPDV